MVGKQQIYPEIDDMEHQQCASDTLGAYHPHWYSGYKIYWFGIELI